MKLPEAFENRMKKLLGDGYEAFYDALCHEDAVKGLRVNTHKVSDADFSENAPFETEQIPYVKGGYIVSEGAGQESTLTTTRGRIICKTPALWQPWRRFPPRSGSERG